MSARAGGCLCGAVRYTLAATPDHIDACHCAMCRKFSGGIELGMSIPDGGITWTGDDNIATYASSAWAERGFCRTCGSSLFWRMTAGQPMLSVNAGTLDDMTGLKVTTEIYVDHKPDAYALAGPLHQMTQAQVEAMFAAPGEGDSQ